MKNVPNHQPDDVSVCVCCVFGGEKKVEKCLSLADDFGFLGRCRCWLSLAVLGRCWLSLGILGCWLILGWFSRTAEPQMICDDLSNFPDKVVDSKIMNSLLETDIENNKKNTDWWFHSL